MTTLPPEGADGQATGGQPASNVPPVPPVPPAAPVPPVPPAPPAQPAAQPAAPQQPQYQVPPQQPQQPQQPQYQAPPQGGQGGYAAPPAPGGYAAAPVADPVSNITLNYWLSVFFSWIPALIFFLIEKDKGNAQVRAYHADNLNFSLVRIMAGIATGILLVPFALIPYVGGVLAFVLWAANIVLFVFQIIAAAKAPEAFRRGEKPPFIFNIQMIK
ncbi:DUF4870 domain-containing protein [Leucobacter viscericola]|uniref:DUF4870 domain-containing protein n=1 Tax=Leucobacter viscericola TaxID=2714935 RepID=A0A6G7XGF2_9MICO|nr:DUF4870 domain-containing protein [Leucobacter viscericola]QIK63684.1 DUF4870 domain-containing protein [Leucobacter viscericola]